MIFDLQPNSAMEIHKNFYRKNSQKLSEEKKMEVKSIFNEFKLRRKLKKKLLSFKNSQSAFYLCFTK
jgi:hypothetical protein